MQRNLKSAATMYPAYSNHDTVKKRNHTHFKRDHHDRQNHEEQNSLTRKFPLGKSITASHCSKNRYRCVDQCQQKCIDIITGNWNCLQCILIIKDRKFLGNKPGWIGYHVYGRCIKAHGNCPKIGISTITSAAPNIVIKTA